MPGTRGADGGGHAAAAHSIAAALLWTVAPRRLLPREAGGKPCESMVEGASGPDPLRLPGSSPGSPHAPKPQTDWPDAPEQGPFKWNHRPPWPPPDGRPLRAVPGVTRPSTSFQAAEDVGPRIKSAGGEHSNDRTRSDTALGISDRQNRLVGFGNPDQLGDTAIPPGGCKADRQRPDHEVVVVQERLQPDVSGAISGE